MMEDVHKENEDYICVSEYFFTQIYMKQERTKTCCLTKILFVT